MTLIARQLIHLKRSKHNRLSGKVWAYVDGMVLGWADIIGEDVVIHTTLRQARFIGEDEEYALVEDAEHAKRIAEVAAA